MGYGDQIKHVNHEPWTTMKWSFTKLQFNASFVFHLVPNNQFTYILVSINSQSNWIFVRTEIFNWYNIQSLLNPNFKKEYTHSNFWIRLLSRVQTQEKVALYKCSWVMESWGLSSRTWQESKKNLLSWTLQIKQPCKQQIPNSSLREKLWINL